MLMHDVPTELRNRLRHFGQDHVLAGWERLTPAERVELTQQLEQLDLGELQSLHARRQQKDALPDFARLARLPDTVETDAQHAWYRRRAEERFARLDAVLADMEGSEGSEGEEAS